MHRNTFIVVVFLAVFAALVVGVNIGRNQSTQTAQVPTSSKGPDSPVVRPTSAPSAELLLFKSTNCGISFSYPQSLTKMETEGGIMLVDAKIPDQSVAVVCQKDIPRPALTDDRIETVKIGSVSAKLYHDTSAKDGTPVDKFIFTHPAKHIDIYVSGKGDVFNGIVTSLGIQ